MHHETETAVLDSYQARIVPLGPNLWAAVFPLMKILPAAFCIRHAVQEGWITSQTLIVESSSGNLALGLAIVCNLRGYKLTIVSDYACDAVLRKRMEELGTRVEIVSGPATSRGYQGARLELLSQIRSETEDHWCLNQYDNPYNPGSYGGFAGQLVSSLGQIDYLVGTVGSGGSMCGTVGYLRELFPDMQAVGVDTFHSVLFGQVDKPRILRGLGNSLIPENLAHEVFDQVHWVTAAEAYRATRVLHKTTSLFCGGTSGAAWMVARHLAEEHPAARVVCIFPDDGSRYVSTIYSDEYLVANGLYLAELPRAPIQVHHPLKAEGAWSCLQWGRQTYEEMTGSASSAKGAFAGANFSA